jgi:uncharacterized protein YjbI with pentapeptide repeats
MTRKIRQNVALIAALLVAGGLCGAGARLWIGGLNRQHAQLERCALASRQTHASEDARSRLAHLDADVPACMNGAGYEKALDNADCGPSVWQGNVFCYVPKSVLGKLVYRIETSPDMKRIGSDRTTDLRQSDLRQSDLRQSDLRQSQGR